MRTVAQIAAPGDYSCVGGPFGSDLTAKDYTGRGVPVIRGSNLSGVGHWMSESGFVYVSDAKADSLRRNLAFPGDLIFTQRGSLGQVARIRSDARAPRYLLSQSQMKLTVDLQKADPDFVCHYFRSAEGQRQILRATTATGVPHINLGSLKSFRLPLPPLEEQRRVAATLMAVDDAIAAGEEVIGQLDRVRRDLAENLLRRGRRPAGGDTAAWGTGTLGEYLREPIRNGYSPVCPAEPTGRWTLSLSAVTPEGFNSSGKKPAPLDDSQVDSAQLVPGDVVVSRSNTRERVGLAGVYLGEPRACSYPDLLMRVRTSDAVLPHFLELQLLSSGGRRYFQGCARGTSGSMLKINRAILEAFPLVVPSLTEQQAIVDAVAAVTARLAAERAALEERRRLKAALADALLTGKIRVPTAQVV